MLPHADQALVDEAKICDYLLSDTHPVGRFKARVFRSLGYTVESWTRLRDDLLHHGQTGKVQRIEMSAYGMKVVISATLKGFRKHIIANFPINNTKYSLTFLTK